MDKIQFRGLSRKEWNCRQVQDVVQFFLFECPASGASRAGKDFSDYGWAGTYFSTLKAELIFVAGNGFNYLPCAKKELENWLTQYPPNKSTQEYAIFLKHDEKRVLESLFKAVRNAIAHGSFVRYAQSKTVYYYFENVDGYVKARINIKESTLLLWSKIIQENPESVRNRVKSRNA